VLKTHNVNGTLSLLVALSTTAWDQMILFQARPASSPYGLTGFPIHERHTPYPIQMRMSRSVTASPNRVCSGQTAQRSFGQASSTPKRHSQPHTNGPHEVCVSFLTGRGSVSCCAPARRRSALLRLPLGVAQQGITMIGLTGQDGGAAGAADSLFTPD
jgi:hypothetical protein